jgi:hypothetical protein
VSPPPADRSHDGDQAKKCEQQRHHQPSSALTVR